MPTFRLRSSEFAKKQLTKAQERRIRQIYENSLKAIEERTKFLEGKDNISSGLRRVYLAEMKSEVNGILKNVGKEVEFTTKDTMYKVAESVVADSRKLLGTLGINANVAFSHVPQDIVRSISSGNLYEGSWTLSKAVWKETVKHQKDIETIISQDLALNKSTYDIAKDIEKYIDPKNLKPWDWSKVYPGTNKVVDYNAQRLARTMASHAYQQSLIRTTKDNPFFLGYEWLTSGSHVCEVCLDYETAVHADGFPPGVFPKDDVPLDHPNGKCTLAVYCTMDTDEIVEAIADWANGGDNPELDDYLEFLENS